jgi:hypothetical protein
MCTNLLNTSSPSSRSGSNARTLGPKSGHGTTRSAHSSKTFLGGGGGTLRREKPSGGGIKGSKKHLNSSSVESLLRQDTPPDPHRDSSNNIKKGNSKLSRSKSMAAPPGYEGRGVVGGSGGGGKDRMGKVTHWFTKRNQK